MIDYHTMLQEVSMRMLFIKTSSLSNDLLNDEWNGLFKIQNELIKLIKIQEKMKDDKQ